MSERRDRRVELERRFLRPDRAPLDPDLARAPTGPDTWAQAIAMGRLPASFAEDPQRRFRVHHHTVVRQLPELADRLTTDVSGCGAHSLAPLPCDRQAARLLCSDPAGMLEAETHARALLDALAEFGVEARPRVIAWRIAGCAVELPHAEGPPLGELRRTVAWLRELMQRLTGRSLDAPHAHRRFEHVCELLEWSHRWSRALDLRVPAELGPLAGRRLGELPDPFTPWLRVIENGYWLVATGRSTIELAAPFPAPDQPRLDKRGRPDIKRRASPRPVWSASLEQLRLACMRGDVRGYATLRRACADTREPGGAPLIHYGLYGGPELLDAMLAADPGLDVDARDDEDRTPLMLAAGWVREGPLGAREAERDVPLGRSRVDETCRWLLAHGARVNAADLRGWTALHWACHEARADAVRVLIGRKAEREANDHVGRTPLHVALARGYPPDLQDVVATVETLIELGADADARDAQGWTGLHYLAVRWHGSPQAELARLLRRHGAQPSRDRLDRSPAALLNDTKRRDLAFDPRTPVAAGPGPWPPARHAVELERALTDDPDRVRLDALAVWADWLQSHGDARGERIAAHVQAASLGRKRRRSAAHALARMQLRDVPLADILYGTEIAPGRWFSFTASESRHGVLTRFGLPPWRDVDFSLLATLLDHEPLLSDLRLSCLRMPLAALLVGARSLAPQPGVRRLVLASLPAELPALEPLASVFPRVRELRLIGAGKLDSLALAWPGLEVLRIRHGDTSEWTQGGSHFELELPELRELDLALPVGARTSEQELDGFRRLLAQLGFSLERLRLSPVDAHTMASLLAHPPPGLRRLVLDRVRGQALEQLANRVVPACPAWLAGLDEIELGVTAQVVEQRAVELATLHAMLPKLRVRAR